MNIRVIPLKSFICFEAFLGIGMMMFLRHCFGVSFWFRTAFFISRIAECKESPPYVKASAVIASSEPSSKPKNTTFFYTKPKIHKKGIPERPVISSVNCHSSKMSEYVDCHQQPITREIPSYIKDTNDFLCKQKSITEVPENSYLVTLDVKPLYTSMQNSEGIKAVKISHENLTKKTIATKVITTFLSLILTLNNFIFNAKHFLQTKGSAMGTICAPSYATIFMDHFERKYIYPLTEGKSLTYFIYIDDIFLMRIGTKNELDHSLNLIALCF